MDDRGFDPTGPGTSDFFVWESGVDVRAAVTAASLDAIIIADAEGRVFEFNPAAEAMFGYRRAAVLGRPIGDLVVPPRLRAAHQAGMERNASGAPARIVGRRLELDAMRADGTEFPVELAITVGESGGRRFFAASLRDLSERRRAEAAQRAVEEFLQAVVDDQTEMVIRSDGDLRIIFCNMAVCRFFGLSREALIGMRFTPGMTPEAEADLAQELLALTPANPVRQGVDAKLTPSGETRWISWSNRALFDAEGRLSGHLSVGRDITRTMLAQLALKLSEARFSAFVENAPIAMFMKDDAGRYVMLNAEAARVIGLPREEILGKTARQVGTPGSADKTDAADARLRETRQPMRVEGPLAAEGQPYHQALVLRFPVAAPEGDAMWIGGFAIDITAQKAAEVDLARSREALNQSEKLNAMGSLLAGVAHELNNPLAIVVGQATMLEEDAAQGPLAKRAERIRRAAERCGRIVQTFLGIARRKPAERRPVSLNDCVTAATELLAYALRTAGVSVHLDLAPDLPAVDGDPDMLHQVVVNLLVNAQQAVEAQAGRRDVLVTTAVRHSEVVLEIADTGPGVPPEIRGRIFEPFFTTKPQGTGTGVGLSFCHSIVVAHGGRFELVATAGPGAVFRVTLPACAAQPAAAAAPEVAGSAATIRVLVVDDEPDLAEMLAEMLETHGYSVDVATSAADAQERIRTRDYALVMSDLRMPGMDGPALFDWLSSERPHLARRTVFVTGDALGAAASRFLAATGRPVLEKPFSRQAALKAAAAVLDLEA